MSIELSESYGVKPVSFAFPYNLVGKIQLFSRHEIRIMRVGHRMFPNITYKDDLVMEKSDITDLSVNSLRWWIKIVEFVVKRRTLLSWHLHLAALYDDKAYKLFEEIVKYMSKKEADFLTFKSFLYQYLHS
jgi:hypothetical protein